MTDTGPDELSELDLARLQERIRPLAKPERREKTLDELTVDEHLERMTARREGRPWTAPLTDEAKAYERQVAAAAGLPDPYHVKSVHEMTPHELYDHINRRTTR